jgi:septal ring factor EnvC (AmiA/AmiB activator)
MITQVKLSENQLQNIGQYVKSHLNEWLGDRHPERVVYDPALMERMVRVEEELKHQRDLMLQGFKRMDERFEMMQSDMDKRFEQVEKRFEQVEKRFEQIDMRFEQVEKRFEQIDKRFEQVDKRFELVTKRIDRFMIWSFGITLTVGGVIIAVLR